MCYSQRRTALRMADGTFVGIGEIVEAPIEFREEPEKSVVVNKDTIKQYYTMTIIIIF